MFLALFFDHYEVIIFLNSFLNAIFDAVFSQYVYDQGPQNRDCDQENVGHPIVLQNQRRHQTDNHVGRKAEDEH